MAVSMISVAEYAPIFIFAFIGGVFADRWLPRRTLIWCDILSAVSVFVVFAVLKTGVWEAVFFTTLLSSILSQFAQPSGMKLFKNHVSDDLAQPAMSLLQILFAVFMVLGPMLGTVIYQTWGIAVSIGITGAAFALSAASLLLIPPDPPVNAVSPNVRNALMHEMKDGIHYVASRRTLLMLSLSFFAVGLGVGVISPLGIFVVIEKLGLPAGEVKWLSIPYGVGEIIGGMITFGLASRIAPRTLLLLGLGVNAVGIIMTGMSSVLWLTMLTQFVIALLQPAIFIGNNALVMKHTDAEYIGRVTGIRTPLMTGGMLIMMSLSGLLKDLLSLEWVYVLGGLFLLAGLLVVLPIERVREKTLEQNEPA